MSQMKRISTADQAHLNNETWMRGRDTAATLAPLDKMAADMEAKWGCNRLPRLVPIDLASKFGSAAQKLDEAIREGDHAAILHRAQVLHRGWQALDKAATEAGHSTNPPNTWSATWEGKPYTIVLDPADHDAAARHSEHPDTVVTLPELLLAWSQWQPAAFAEATKAAFPGATVQRSSKSAFADLDDDIPF